MKTILLVDDSKTIINQLQQSITKNLKNVQVLIAYTYKEAVKHILQTNEIHVALLDLNLPDAKEGDIVDFALSKKIPSIVLTGLINDTLREYIMKKDIIDYYNKQNIINIDQLISKIDRTLKNYDSNILLVDDSKVDREFAKKYLATLNINYHTATNGKEALELIEKDEIHFDLVLTDYYMPILNGMELTMKIREKYNKDQLGILVFSASDKPDITSEFLKMGANDVITKPYSKIEFITRVNTNLELIDLFKKTRDLANRDFLTGSYNRRYFFESGKSIFAKAKRAQVPLCVAMFDIDKFKTINDSYGHDAGDDAIKEIAKILEENLRKSDLIARFGGEEFCVLLENISLQDVKKLFEKIRLKIKQNILNFEEYSIQFTTSIGVYYGMNDSLEDMIKIADKNLYYCKNNGRDQVYLTQ